MYSAQYAKVGRLSLLIPSTFIIGLLTKTDEDPVIAKTRNILIISQRYLTSHFFSSFSKIKSVNFKSTKKIKILKAVFKNTDCFSIKREDNLKAEKARPIIPKTRKISCQLL